MTRKVGGTDARGSAAGSGRRGRMRNSFSSCGSRGTGRQVLLGRFGWLENLAGLAISPSLARKIAKRQGVVTEAPSGCYKLYLRVTNCSRLLLTVTISTRLLPTVPNRQTGQRKQPKKWSGT